MANNEHELVPVDQDELMAVEGGAIFQRLKAAVTDFVAGIDRALAKAQDPETWRNVSVYHPQ